MVGRHQPLARHVGFLFLRFTRFKYAVCRCYVTRARFISMETRRTRQSDRLIAKRIREEAEAAAATALQLIAKGYVQRLRYKVSPKCPLFVFPGDIPHGCYKVGCPPLSAEGDDIGDMARFPISAKTPSKLRSGTCVQHTLTRKVKNGRDLFHGHVLLHAAKRGTCCAWCSSLSVCRAFDVGPIHRRMMHLDQNTFSLNLLC